MAEYNIVEIAYMSFLRAKHGAIKIIDSVRPHIILKKNLTDYNPREFFGMEVGEVARILGYEGEEIGVTY